MWHKYCAAPYFHELTNTHAVVAVFGNKLFWVLILIFTKNYKIFDPGNYFGNAKLMVPQCAYHNKLPNMVNNDPEA